MDYQKSMQNSIKKELDKKAEDDKLFAASYCKKNKSIEECCDYIQSVAYDYAKKGGKGLNDEDVFSLAIHYYLN